MFFCCFHLNISVGKRPNYTMFGGYNWKAEKYHRETERYDRESGTFKKNFHYKKPQINKLDSYLGPF